MYLKSILIENYKSYLKSEPIEFVPGINLIVGPNNSGKTALLEALSLRINHSPHRGPAKTGAEVSTVRPCFLFSNSEIQDSLATRKSITMPVFENGTQQTSLSVAQSARKYGLSIELVATHGSPYSNHAKYRIEIGPEFVAGQNNISVFMDKQGNPAAVRDERLRVNEVPTFESKVRTFVESIFYIKGERMNLHSSLMGASLSLSPDASNLPVVLFTSQQSRNSFESQFVTQVRRVLPIVKDVSVSHDSHNNLKIDIWPEQQPVQGGGYSYSLEHCGSGVGQVLAIMYVIAFAKPSAIVIDEPNSFLHPSATREMLRIFKENTQHQYFISTHSSEVFNEVRPEQYVELNYENYQTSAKVKYFSDLSDTYHSLGISPFYEFSYWVEGPTEVLSFPHIVKDPTVRFIDFNVSDLISRKSSRAEINRLLDLHERFLRARQSEPIDPKMAIVVDREHLDAKDKQDFERRDIVFFLKRKMFENYILHPKAISEVIAKCIDNPPTEINIQEFLDLDRGNQSVEEWQMECHGANILDCCFAELTETRCQFDKTNHSVAITQWIALNDPDFLDDLREELTVLRKHPESV